MIGNDIVDLHKASLESNWLRRGYLDKLFRLQEQRLIYESINPGQMVWLLWSMKEACYKAHFRQHLIRTFQPQRILCSNLLVNENGATGQIDYGGRTYFSKSMLTADLVHTSAVLNYSAFNNLHTFIKSDLVDSKFETVRYDYCMSKTLLQKYRIYKDRYGIPSFLDERTGELQPISLSRHGRFSSLVFFQKSLSID